MRVGFSCRLDGLPHGRTRLGGGGRRAGLAAEQAGEPDAQRAQPRNLGDAEPGEERQRNQEEPDEREQGSNRADEAGQAGDYAATERAAGDMSTNRLGMKYASAASR